MAALPPALDWDGLTLTEFQTILRQYGTRPRSPALRALWVDVLLAAGEAPVAPAKRALFDTLRMEALYRLGAVDAVRRLAAGLDANPAQESARRIIQAKAALATGDGEAGCNDAGRRLRELGRITSVFRPDAVRIAVFCAALADDLPRAGLYIELARDKAVSTPAAAAILDAMTLGRSGRPAANGPLSLLQGRLLGLSGYRFTGKDVARARAPLLLAMALDDSLAGDVRLAAAERGASRGIIRARDLRRAYLDARPKSRSPATRRAAAMKRIAASPGAAPSGGQTLAAMRELLAAGRGAAFYTALASAAAPELRKIPRNASTARNAQTAIQIAGAAGDLESAVGWAIFAGSANGSGAGSGRLMHWLMPLDVLDSEGRVPRGAGLVPSERLARAGRFSPAMLHRLVTVLETFGYRTPIPLWEAASRSPQPAKGFLPETGLLGRLRNAADKKQTLRVMVLAIAALGPDGAGGAHLISLGDSLKAMRAVGLERQARRIAFELLFPAWPRTP